MRSASADPEARSKAAAEFLRFVVSETREHFRVEEELVFPLVDPPPEPVLRTVAEHARIRALVERLRRSLDAGDVDPALAVALGEALTEHIRLEEREVFPLIEELADEDVLAALVLPGSAPHGGEDGAVVDLGRLPGGRGPLWGTATADLNATLLAWDPGEGTPAHVNDERDVLVVVLSGSGVVRVDGNDHPVFTQQAVIVPKGSERAITAGREGIRYLSVHLRRPGLQVGRMAARGTP